MKQRNQKHIALLSVVLVPALLLSACGSGASGQLSSSSTAPGSEPAVSVSQPEPEPQPAVTALRFSATGDNLIHDGLYLQARNRAGGEGYDFTALYENVAPFYKDFDINWKKNAARIDELIPAGKVDVHRTYGDYCYKGYRHSLAHGWASGPTAWLSEYVLGVKIVEPGCKAVKIEPNLGGLEWVEGTVPTPYGVIKVRHEKQADGKIKSKIEVPKGVKVVK